MSFHDGFKIVVVSPTEFTALEGEFVVGVIRRFCALPVVDRSEILARLGIEGDWAPKEGEGAGEAVVREIVERGLLDALDVAVWEIEGKGEGTAR